MDKFLLLIKVSRPLYWILAPAVFLIGLTYFGSATITTLSLIEILLLSFPWCLFIYGINDIYDYESDRINPRKGWRTGAGIILEPKYHSYVKNVSFFIILLMLLTSILTLNISNILGMVLLVFFSYFYSAPPLRFKERPPLDSISNGIMFFSAVLLGFSFSRSIFDAGIDVYLIAACVIAIHAYSTIMDYPADKGAGNKTFAVVFGKRYAAVFALFIFVLTLFLTVPSGIIKPVTYYYLAFCSLLFFITAGYPSEDLASWFTLSIFIGFVLTGIAYLFLYVLF